MPNQTTERPDHPARIIEGLTNLGGAAATGAEILRAYERDHGVTFEALDTATLADLRSAFARIGDPLGSRDEALAVADLVTAVRDLFGLGE